MNFLLGNPIFRCYVSFNEGIWFINSAHDQKSHSYIRLSTRCWVLGPTDHIACVKIKYNQSWMCKKGLFYRPIAPCVQAWVWILLIPENMAKQWPSITGAYVERWLQHYSIYVVSWGSGCGWVFLSWNHQSERYYSKWFVAEKDTQYVEFFQYVYLDDIHILHSNHDI